MSAPRSRLVNALLRWLRRYLPAELVCTPCALLCGFAATELTGSPAAAAIAATWGENLGFYGVMLGRELAQRRGVHALPAVVRDLLIEFGPAEALDSFLLRPASIYAGLSLAPHPALGIVAGKLLADLSFYTPAIITHELQRWYALAVSGGNVNDRRRLLPVLGVLVTLSLATASFAQSLQGTWVGSITCKDERVKSTFRHEGTLLISQPNGPGMGPLHVTWDSTSYFGQIFPFGGDTTFPPGTTAGLGTLISCTAGPGGFTDVELLRWKIDESGGGSLKVSGTHASPYSHGPCKGSFTRTSTTDPGVADCP